MSRVLLLSFALFSSLSLADTGAPLPAALDFSHAWFKPTLEQSHSPVCADLLRSTEQAFFSNQSLKDELMPDGLQEQSPSSNSLQLDGQPVYFNTYTHSGCGGGCENYQIVASPIPREHAYWADEEQLDKSPPPSSKPRLFADANQQVFVLSTPDYWQPLDTLLLHKLKADLSWEEICRINVAPSRTQRSDDKQLQATLSSISKLSSTLGPISGGSGNECGSLRPGDLRENSRADAFSALLSRPWGQYSRAHSPEDLGEQFRTDSENLNRWALTGTLEFQAVRNYQAQLTQTTQVLADFYQSHFGWQQGQTRQIAHAALLSAVSSGLAFPSHWNGGYHPFPDSEHALRQAILEKRPITQIRYQGGTVSDLSIAILYPEALSYLLEQGADPNQRNPFGKTPLMYAAQYNQLESARLLLAKGANANATTIWPTDRCTYQLSTRNMTALHYAARYASPELIDLLLEKGAEPFIQSVSTAYQDGRIGTPLDWLRRHNTADAKEPNPHIPATRIAALAQALQVAAPEQLQQRARQLTLQSEKDYAQGNSLQAYQTLLLAREAAPQDARILSNLSLVAFKLGEHGPALEAGQQLLDSSQDAKLLANAWFNQGLVCDAAGGTSYNGKYYCKSGSLYPYYRAAALRATPARQTRLLERLNSRQQKHCTAAYGEQQVRIVWQSDGRRSEHGYVRQTLYVLHPSALPFNAGDIAWQLKNERISPYAAATLALGEWTLSVLESPAFMNEESFQVAGQACALRQDDRK
ncbi:ankyrin repeat domain-containing protein [Aquipseudomonas campi]|uniref:Ankyrin repeat domain-containing protein n=1 Tax=Aquipseudomonas campi TaxID=2731681 RepID=A0ACD0YHJ1_9GAMM|nr:ankyrin repeat domain-containing protein [Pseudomonas campi]QKE64147.2 ankyrin repeat domain-containing protein [Pseudomonas campi]